MPFYSFTNEKTGATIEEHFSMADVPPRIKRHGLIWKKDFVSDHKKTLGEEKWDGNIWRGSPPAIMSGVPPKQLGQLAESLKRQGVEMPRMVPDARGMMQPDYKSRRQRNEYIKARGLRDNDAGYGDYGGA